MASREEFLTQRLAERSTELDHARSLLRTFPCPLPARGDPRSITIGECMDRQNCGCEYGVACGYVATTARQAPAGEGER